MVHGTTQRAAEVLNISQPGVSKALQELERQLGFRLFDRVRQRLVPTAEGRLYFREVENSFAALSRLRSAGARIRDFGSGEIRVATLSGLSTNIVPRALSRFQKRHPNVQITLQVLMSSAVKDLVATSTFDFGLAADEIDTTGVDAEQLAVIRGVVVMPPGHPLANLAEVTPADLDTVDFVALSPEDTSRQALEQIFEANGVSPRTVLETPFANTICAMALAGLGCGFVNPLSAEPFLKQGLIVRRFSQSVYFRTLLIRPIEIPASRIVEDCILAIREEVEQSTRDLV